MVQAAPAITRTYPCTIRLPDNSEVTLRRLAADDEDRIVSFARSLPEEDLLFLRVDITDPDVVRAWLAEEAAGRALTLIAEAQGQMVGYGRLNFAETTWQRHLGEMRLMAGRWYRGQGLGRALAVEVFALARDLGLRKVIARMTTEQKGAIAVFERLGFQPEALLRGFAIDRAGRTRDLVVMAYDVEGLTDRVD